jgi:hypothetical protein
MSKRSRAIAAVVGVIAIVVVVIVATNSSRSDAPRAAGAADPDVSGAGGGGGDSPERARPPRREPPSRDVPTGDPSQDFDVAELLANYKKLTRYPPDSRLLDREQVDLLHPDARQEGPVRIGERDRRDPSKPQSEYMALFTGDRYVVTGEQTLTSTLRVWRGDKGAGEPVEITGATVTTASAGGEEELATLQFTPTTGPDGVTYRNTFTPAGTAKATGQYDVELSFTAPDGTQAQGRLDFLYTPAAQSPGRFTGKFREELRSGSLFIGVQVEVKQAGRFRFDANLFDAEDEPVASAHADQELAVGKQWIDLPFFGLIFHDKNVSGKFTLRTLRGDRFSPGETPDRQLLPGFDGSYTTASYPLDVFSTDEWDSPDKQRQIQAYEDMLGH